MKFKSVTRQFCIFLFINSFIAAAYSQAPNQPVNPVPANQAGSVSINPNVCATVSDPNGGTLQIRYYGRQTPANGTEKFTIVLLPDTQYYTEEPQGNHQGGIAAMFNAQTAWIANNRQSMNIVYVGQLGDCTQNGDDPPGADNDIEWQRVNTAISTIESPALTGLPQGIPYGLSVGNHDQSPGGGGNTAATAKYNKYFGPSRFDGRSYYGGHQGNDITNNDNHYQLFSASGIDFLVISMEYDTSPETAVLDWAANLVQTYSNRKVIVMTHFGINETGSPKPTFGAQGQAIYDKLKQYPNFMLFVCGHIHQSDGEARRTDIFNGNTVHTVLSDYQERPGGGNGLLRIMEFDPAQNKISVKTYSPYANTYETDADSQFDLSFNMLPVIGQVNNVASGANPCFSWNNLLNNTGYEWGMELYDGQNITTGPVWKFTTAGADLVPPTVSSVTPVNGAAGISISTTISAIFNEAMDATTINNSTIELRNPSNGLITATVSYNAATRTATLTPSAALTNSTIYTAKVISGLSGVKDAAGNPLASDYSWSFTTVAGDITPPTVSSVTPVNGTTGVSISTTVSAIFNEAMDATTINSSTIELRNPSNGLITATVSYNAGTRTATLTPSAALTNSTIYTAKVISGSSGVKDAAGNPLASDYSWSFTTVAGDITPPTVSSVTPVNGTTGVSISTTVSAIFNEAMDATTINNSTIELRNPSNGLITATVSYNAATRTATLTPSAALTNSTIYTAKVISGSSGVKDATGNPLASDYSWSFTTVAGDITPPTVSSVTPVNGTTGISISTTVSAIFNEAMNATTINSSTIELRNPSNGLITATVSYNAGTRTATLAPSAALANSTIYTAKIISGSAGVKDAAGNPLASDYSWAFTTVAGDITPPTVSSVTPVNGTTGVSISTTVSAIFNEAMDATTINSSTIELRNPSNALITSTVSYNAATRTANLTPSVALLNSTIYTAKVISGSAGVKDATGNPLASDYSWSFTTVAGDITPPTVSSVTPVNGTTGVSISTTVSAIFNEAMNVATINSSTIELRNPSNGLIAATVSYNAATRTATLTPSATLANSTIYTAKIISGSAGVKDATGNPLASDYSWSFTTVAGDITPPTVSSVTPVNGTTGVSVSTTVSAIFNEAMDATTINSSTIELRNPSNALITATVSYNATTRTATLTPSATLANSTIYTAKIISGSAGVKDATGNPLASDYSWSFTTIAVPSQPPVSIQSFTTKTGTAATVHSLTGVPAGALLVLATTSDAVTSNCNVSSSPSLTWTKRADAGATRSDNAEIWTAVYSAGGAITVTSNWGAVSQASVCYVVLNAESSLGGTSGTAVSQSAPSVTITTTRNNSILFGCTADWNAVNGTTRTLRDAATERLYFKDANFTTYYYTKSAASMAAYTEGISLPTGQQASTALLEIRSASGAADIVPPTVSSVTPTNGATGISVSTTASAIFNEAMDATTINSSTIELRNPSNALITATVSYNAGTRTATLTPSDALANSTVYTAKVISGLSGVKDAAGNPLASDYSWSFTTVVPDIVPPTVSSVTPVNGAAGTSISTTVSAIFNEAMNVATINSSTIELRNPSNGLITATVSYNAGTRTATLTPSATLANSTIYTAKVKSGASGVKDAAGNALASDYSWSFTTVAVTSQPLVSIQSFTTQTGRTATTHSLTGVPAGALLVLATTSDAVTSNCSISSSPSLTWTKRADAGASNSDNSEIWTAAYSAGGSITVTSNWGAVSQASVCYIVLNAESSLGGTSGTAVSQSAPSVTITTTRNNSIIFGCTADWNAVNGTTRTLRDAATERLYFKDSYFTTYYYTKTAASIAAYTEGVSLPTGQQASTALLEIRGAGTASARLANSSVTTSNSNNSRVYNYSLAQNYPNPFNKVTTLQFTVPKAEKVNLTLFDISGRAVNVLVNGSRDAGTHIVNFNAGSLAKGIYYYRMQAGNFTDVKKLTIR